jgi:hypothetical protein
MDKSLKRAAMRIAKENKKFEKTINMLLKIIEKQEQELDSLVGDGK